MIQEPSINSWRSCDDVGDILAIDVIPDDELEMISAQLRSDVSSYTISKLSEILYERMESAAMGLFSGDDIDPEYLSEAQENYKELSSFYHSVQDHIRRVRENQQQEEEKEKEKEDQDQE